MEVQEEHVEHWHCTGAQQIEATLGYLMTEKSFTVACTPFSAVCTIPVSHSALIQYIILQNLCAVGGAATAPAGAALTAGDTQVTAEITAGGVRLTQPTTFCRKTRPRTAGAKRED